MQFAFFVLLATGCLGSALWAAWLGVRHESDFMKCFAYILLCFVLVFGLMNTVSH